MAANYGLTGADKAELENQYTAPFDCAFHGDLCDLVGPMNGAALLDKSGQLALLGAPDADFNLQLESDIWVMEETWLAFLFPAGIPASDPYWGPPNPAAWDTSLQSDIAWGSPGECDSVSFTNDPSIRKREYRDFLYGTTLHRIRSRAWWMNIGVYRTEGGTSRTFVDSGGGSFVKVAMTQTINVAGANKDTSCPSYCDSWTHTAAKVKLVAFWSVGKLGAGMFRYVNAEASFSGVYSAIADVTNWTSVSCAP